MKISFKLDIKEEDVKLVLKMLFDQRISGFEELLSVMTIGDINYNKADGSGFTSTDDIELFMKQLEFLCNEHSVDIDWLPSILLITTQYSQFDDDVHADTYKHNILISDAEFLLSNMVTSYRRYIELRNAKVEVLPEDRFLSLIKKYCAVPEYILHEDQVHATWSKWRRKDAMERYLRDLVVKQAEAHTAFSRDLSMLTDIRQLDQITVWGFKHYLSKHRALEQLGRHIQNYLKAKAPSMFKVAISKFIRDFFILNSIMPLNSKEASYLVDSSNYEAALSQGRRFTKSAEWLRNLLK